jgi:hypothetical protein
MTRESVTPGQLLEILNRELAKHDAWEGCAFKGSIRRLPVVDGVGCNWSTRNLAVRCKDRSAHGCADIATQILETARERYSLPPRPTPDSAIPGDSSQAP